MVALRLMGKQSEKPVTLHCSIRDIYTANDGSMVVRLENEKGRMSVCFESTEIHTLLQGLTENARLQPLPQHPPQGTFSDARSKLQRRQRSHVALRRALRSGENARSLQRGRCERCELLRRLCTHLANCCAGTEAARKTTSTSSSTSYASRRAHGGRVMDKYWTARHAEVVEHLRSRANDFDDPRDEPTERMPERAIMLRECALDLERLAALRAHPGLYALVAWLEDCVPAHHETEACSKLVLQLLRGEP